MYKNKLFISIICLFLIFSITGCYTTRNPRYITISFIKDISMLDFDMAEKLITDDSKNSIKAKGELILSDPEYYQYVIRNIRNISSDSLGKLLKLDSMVEFTQKQSSKIFNSYFEVMLKKNNGQWKIIATEKLVNDIIYVVSRKKDIYDRLFFLNAQFEEKIQLIRNMIFLLKKKNEINFDFFKIDSLLIEKRPITENFSKKELDEFVKYQIVLDEIVNKIWLQVGNSSILSKMSDLDDLKLMIEVQNKRIGISVHEYNQFVQLINPIYKINFPLVSESNRIDF